MDFVCPVCGKTEFNEEAAKDSVYCCINRECESCLKPPYANFALCKRCGVVYPVDRFGKHGDVYECKECGQVNWPLTDHVRNIDEELNKLQKIIDEAREHVASFEADARKARY